MKKAIIILLTALVALSVFVSCNQDSIIDEEFNKFATVTFDSNNGSGLTATQTIMKKTPTALDANGFKYAEHAFVCWNTKADGAGDTYTDTQEVKLESSMTLYAQWSEVDTITEETTTLVPGRAYTTAGEETIISERIMISASDIIEEGGSTSRDAILKEERKPVVIFLEKGTTLIVEKGIEVAEGQELNIQGSGTLIATAGVGAAGIGGGPGVNAGTIVISGGTIITTGGTFAAGIGGGKEGNGGVVTIIDGDVTATGGLSGGAGIGGGNKGNGGNVSILGGTVNVFGGEPSVSIPRGIAIGAGHGGKSAGTLEIGEGLGLYGGKDEASAEFLSFPTDSYTGARCEFMETKETQYATITFAANGGEGEMEAQVVPYNIPRKLNANEFTHETLFFDGWALSEEGEVKYKNQAQIELDGDITLYAHWIDVIMIDDTYGGADGKKLEGGKRYSIESDQTIEKRLYIDGTDEVTLTLPQGNTLTLSSGLNVASGQSLAIEGEGSLIATAVSSGDAGIGGSKGASGGTITIKGGTVTATGAGGTGTDGGGAGIGGGHNGSGGTVIISGGTVTATGGGAGELGGGGSGIGSGHNSGSLGSVSGGTITISGGTVNATGGATNNGRGGAGLGGGNYADGADVSITGGTVTATAAPGTVGIGAGKDSTKHGSLEIGDGMGLYGGADKDNVAFLSAPVDSYAGDRPVYMKSEATEYVTVTFNKNNEKAEGTMDSQSVPKDFTVALGANEFTLTDWYFAGWNTASDGSGDSYSDKSLIKIDSSTTLYAQWTDGIPLDDSYGGSTGKKLEGGKKYTMIEDLTLSGRLIIVGTSDVTLTLLKDKTLTLEEGLNVDSGHSLVIEGEGTLTATGASGMAGIGGSSSTYLACGTVTINGGTVTATGGMNAAGIGGGPDGSGGTVTINGGTVTATGGMNAAGIGGGAVGAGGKVTITGGTVTATCGNGGVAGIGRGYEGDSNGTLKIGDGQGLYGGADKDNVAFLSAPVDSYTGDRPAYMETMATTYVTVKFDANEGTGSMSDQTMPSGFATDLTKNTFSKDSLTFGGWALSSTGDYKYADQEKITITAGLTLYAQWIDTPTVLTGSETTLAAGTNYTIDSDLTFSGDRLSIDTGSSTDPVTIIVPKDKTLTLSKGISVISGQTLIIKGAGKLIANAESGSGNAAIGATKGVAGGDVKIYGGIITATGARRGAGIGGGAAGEQYWKKENKSGNIYIYGGKVTATGGDEAAGIGSGNYGETQTIVISGGEVTAQGGIGDGYESSGANVTITGGIVKAVDYPSGISGSLKIGDGLALFGGESKDNAVFLSGPVASYSGSRYTYMETKAADLVTITFNANEGAGTMPDQTAASGYAVKLNANAFTNGDWYFGGWASTKTGDIEYEDKASITVDANTTLYAKWVDAIPIFSTTTVLDGGKKYTIVKDLTNNHRLSINGTEAAIIDLPEGMTLTLTNGISVPTGKSLTIQGEGTLTVSVQHDPYGETSYYAGIGGGRFESGGTITIEGGIVNATGGKWGGAGIGGGGGDSRTSDYYRGGDGGTITIEGGTVTATGGSDGGAGIGGGRYAKEGGTISIEGGSVTAQGGSGAAAIGGGAYGCNGGYITISGTDTIVDATGGSDAGAGIGGGKEGGAGGTIIISGGTVTARGGKSAYSSGGGAAGIGGGSGTASYEGGAGGTITISGGDVTAIGNKNAAGIGGGGSFSDTKGGAGGTVNITGGTVKATGGESSRAIGKGKGINIAWDGTLIVGANMGLYGGASQSKAEYLSKPTNSWPDDLDHRPLYMEVKPTDYVTITYDGNGGEGQMSSDLMVKDFAFYDLTANKFTTPDEGKIFIGWATSATGDVVYSDEGTISFSKSETLYAKWGTDVVITDSLNKLVAGHNHINIGDVTNNNRLYITGGDSATITLTEGKTVTLTHGINVPYGKTLTIDGNGELIASGGSQQAGIGGNENENAGNVIIENGTITANGNAKAAGIGAGGGTKGSNGYGGGVLTINGGTVTANGGNDGGAGIGGSSGPSLTNPGPGGTVIINNGIVIANGGGGAAAGIGGGPGTVGHTTINITINGGTVTATGTGGGAGIGGFKDHSGGNVIINGGSVTATGSINPNITSVFGVGIGRGSNYQCDPDNGKLTIGYAEGQTNTLTINDGWSLNYGNTAPSSTVNGPHAADDINNYVGVFMTVTAPTV